MVEPKDLLTPSISQNLLDTKEKRQRVAMDLQALQAQPGWVFIERVLKEHIDAYANQILSNDALSQEEEVALKRERAFFLLFKTLPVGWVAELMEQEATVKENQDDPYA